MEKIYSMQTLVGLQLFGGGTPTFSSGTPTCCQMGVLNSCFQNPSESSVVPSFLDGSSSFLEIIRPTIEARMSLNLDKIPYLTSELAPLEHQKN